MGSRKGPRGAAGGIYLVLLIAGGALALATGWMGGQVAHSHHEEDEHLPTTSPAIRSHPPPAPDIGGGEHEGH